MSYKINVTIFLLFAFTSIMHAQNISLSSKAFFNITTFSSESRADEDFYTFSNYGASAKFKAREIIGVEAGIRYERKRNDEFEADYLIFPVKVLFSLRSRNVELDIGVGLFAGQSLNERYNDDEGRIISLSLNYRLNSRISIFSEMEQLKGWGNSYSSNGRPGFGPGGGAYEQKMISLTFGGGVSYRLFDFSKE